MPLFQLVHLGIKTQPITTVKCLKGGPYLSLLLAEKAEYRLKETALNERACFVYRDSEHAEWAGIHMITALRLQRPIYWYHAGQESCDTFMRQFESSQGGVLLTTDEAVGRLTDHSLDNVIMVYDDENEALNSHGNAIETMIRNEKLSQKGKMSRISGKQFPWKW